MRPLGPLARAIAVFAAVLCTSPAFCQAWLGASSGTVEGAMLGEDRWKPLGHGASPLTLGMHVRTAPNGSATIVFADKSRVKLGHGTELILDEFAPRSSAVKLQNGSLEAFAQPSTQPSLRVRTPTAFVSASGAEFSADVSALKDTQLVAYGGVITVRLQNGESAQYGEGKDYRSVMVVAGRPLRLLPHPREDAGTKSTAVAGAATVFNKAVVTHEWPDCLHQQNGALRPAIEEVSACQHRVHDKLAKSGNLTLEDSADLRTHQQEELREYARAHGWMPAALEGEPEAAEGGETASEDGSGAAAASAGGGGDATGLIPGIDPALAKSLQGMGFDPTTAGGLAGGANGQLSQKDQALLKQLQSSGAGGSGGGQVSPGALNMLFQSLLDGHSSGTGAAKPQNGAP